MTTIKREKFMTIQAKGGDTGNGKDVVDDVVETASSIASKKDYLDAMIASHTDSSRIHDCIL